MIYSSTYLVQYSSDTTIREDTLVVCIFSLFNLNLAWTSIPSPTYHVPGHQSTNCDHRYGIVLIVSMTLVEKDMANPYLSQSGWVLRTTCINVNTAVAVKFSTGTIWRKMRRPRCRIWERPMASICQAQYPGRTSQHNTAVRSHKQHFGKNKRQIWTLVATIHPKTTPFQTQIMIPTTLSMVKRHCSCCIISVSHTGTYLITRLVSSCWVGVTIAPYLPVRPFIGESFSRAQTGHHDHMPVLLLRLLLTKIVRHRCIVLLGHRWIAVAYTRINQ